MTAYHRGVDPRLRTAVDASLSWYEDIFALHGIPTAVQHGLWKALGEPPRWHSSAKTVTPTVVKGEVLRAVEAFEHCSIADSFGVLDLSDSGFAVLFEATWVHHPPHAHSTGALPAGWTVIAEEEELEVWNREHDTLDVLLPSLLSHPRFRFLRHEEDGNLMGGAVLHDTGGDSVGLSNQWTVAGGRIDPSALLSCAGTLHPGRAVVAYERGDDLDAFLDAGFDGLGPQYVWARTEHGRS